ncbi:MAG: glycosyltransferase family 4 protein [Muribaculaceae bacterium]|nr:glycosyltransferase family 4 protein [Muribaculaceae bacterium]
MFKIIRVTTIPRSLKAFCSGLPGELREELGAEVVAVSSPEKALVEYGSAEGVRTVGVPMERHISPLRDLRSLWSMIRVFRKERPAMVHSMTPKAGLISMMAAWVCRVPVRIHTFTGLVFPTSTGLKQKILMFTDGLTCACATHVIPEGEGVKADLTNYGITRKPLRVLGHGNVKGIDLERFDPTREEVRAEALRIRKELGISPDDFVFVFIGRLVGDKGINELVEAFGRLQKEHPEVRLILVGPEEAELDPLKGETMAEIGSNDAISAVGRQSDVRPWYAVADAFVFPSYREGFPNCVIEAGAMGLPSIVTDINGSREIVLDGENGVVIPSKNSKALYDAMRDFVEDDDRRGRMAAKARELMASRFEQSYVRGCLKDFYRTVLFKH